MVGLGVLVVGAVVMVVTRRAPAVEPAARS
jgi:hypothetical protein